VSFSRVGRQGAAAATLLACLLVQDVIADAPQPAGASTSTESLGSDLSTAADPASPQPSTDNAAGEKVARAAPDRSAFEAFLDHLMRAESGGRDTAANPRSTALGPYQFIKSTFLDLARRRFGVEVQELSEEEILKLRTNRAFARRCAETYSRENFTFLSGQGLQPTFGHLRLAFLLGPFAAARVLQAAPATPVAEVLGPAVIRANPFMARMSASNLIARTARDVGESASEVDIATPPQARLAAAHSEPVPRPRSVLRGLRARPPVHVRLAMAQAEPVSRSRAVLRGLRSRHTCNAKLASCRKFVELQVRVAKSGRQHLAKVAPSRATRALSATRRNTAEFRRRGAGA